MARIGRNEPCICGSGMKYKKCCLYKEPEEQSLVESIGENPLGEEALEGSPEEKKTIHSEVEIIKAAAADGRQLVRTSGVLILFSTEEGDAWLLEVTEQDALQLMDNGEQLDVEIEENPETTMVEWGHTFLLKKDKFVATSYKDKKQQRYDGYPVAKISQAMKGIKKRIPKSWANMVHVPMSQEKGS